MRTAVQRGAQTLYAVSGIGITGWGETPYNVSVGGTDFEDVYNSKEANPAIPLSTYWNATNTGTYRLGQVVHSGDSLERFLRQLF